MSRTREFALLGTLLLACLQSPVWAAYDDDDPVRPPLDKGSAGTLAVDGQFVHNVGELQLNITNWGLIGSHPGDGTSYSEAPSAMWPAGSGIEYLWAAGLWVGAVKGGVPLVSTGQFTPEFMALPTDPLETVFTSRSGDTGGNRYPHELGDDDLDGKFDEDPHNGIDDDLDGRIDEDFEILGNQMFRLVCRDNGSLVRELWPEHEPLGLQLTQTSFQWEDDNVDDFVGFRFELENIGVEKLEDVYVGLFADCDIGPREAAAIGMDDLPGFWQGSARARDRTTVYINVAYMYDADGDEGQAPGFFGVSLLGGGPRLPYEPGKSLGSFPARVRTFHTFAGNQPFDAGGDPTNDFERYSLLSTVGIDSTPALFDERKANDYRILVGWGPGATLRPGEELGIDAAFVVGSRLYGLIQNTTDAVLTYYGGWFDRDGDPQTGVIGRQYFVCAEDFGSPASNSENPIFDMYIDACDTNQQYQRPIKLSDLDKHGCIWINPDCSTERFRRGEYDCNLTTHSPYAPPSGCTGVFGREHNVPWIVGLPPSPPDMRIWQSDNRVHLFWNSKSELEPDVLHGVPDFESYRLWRADGWDRPFGTSIENGPGSPLWRLLAEYDVVNSYEDRRVVDNEEIVEELPLGRNTGLDAITYVPRMNRPGDPACAAATDARELVQLILEDPAFAHLDYDDDPADHLRVRDRNGRLTDVARRYPEIADFEGSWAEIDTAYWTGQGVGFYEYVDHNVLNGFAYFYAVTTTDHSLRPTPTGPIETGHGANGDPQGNFQFATARFDPQTAQERDRDGQNVFVFPNPATNESLAEFSEFHPNGDDPTGVRVMFANLPASRNTIKIFTLFGDLVQVIEHDGTTSDCEGNDGWANCGGAAFWNLVSRSGQEVVSGIYLYSVESSDPAFDRVVGRFVVVR